MVVVPPLAAEVATMVRPAVARAVTPVGGTVRGTYTIPLPEPGGGLTYTFEGSGQVTPLGQVKASGTGQSPAAPGSGPGQNQGLLTLSNSQGTVTLRLTGPARVPVTSLVNRFVVQSGTGAYGDLSGRGTVMLRLSPTSVDSGGEFTLMLHPGRRR
jgi:hypothetical protein